MYALRILTYPALFIAGAITGVFGLVAFLENGYQKDHDKWTTRDKQKAEEARKRMGYPATN